MLHVLRFVILSMSTANLYIMTSGGDAARFDSHRGLNSICRVYFVPVNSFLLLHISRVHRRHRLLRVSRYVVFVSKNTVAQA